MNWIAEEQKAVFQTYYRQPLVLVKGKGSFVWDEKGKKYLDFFSGLAVDNFGHCDAAIAKAVSDQMRRIVHTSNLYYTIPQIQLAQRLIKNAFPGKVFYSNSGAEANECALKLTRRWARKHNLGNEIISFESSFHGRTMGAISLTGQPKYQKGFEPLVEKMLYAKFNDLESVGSLVTEKTCAIFVEPVQGEGGVIPATKEFLQGLRDICDQENILLVFDEVQTAMGRTGNVFAYQHYGVKPDVMCLAKALGGGLPIGATIARTGVAEIFEKGDHAATFGGNAVVCRAALEVMKKLTPAFLKSVRQKGEFLKKELMRLKSKYPFITEVRGLGLMVGLVLERPGKVYVEMARENGLLINCTQEKVLRFLPPLTISTDELKKGIAVLDKVLGQRYE